MLQPSYGAGWPGEGNGEQQPPLWRRLARWLPPLLLLLLSLGSYSCLLTLVLLPTVGVATVLGDEVRRTPSRPAGPLTASSAPTELHKRETHARAKS